MFKSKLQVYKEINDKYSEKNFITDCGGYRIKIYNIIYRLDYFCKPDENVYEPIYKSLADFEEMYAKFSELVNELINTFDIRKKHCDYRVTIGCVDAYIEQKYNFFGQSKLAYKICYYETGTEHSYNSLQALVDDLKLKFPNYIKIHEDIKNSSQRLTKLNFLLIYIFMDLIRELSKIYDVKKHSDDRTKYDCFYIEYNGIKIYVYSHDTYAQYVHGAFHKYYNDINFQTKRIEFTKLFIDKITNLFIYTVEYGASYDRIVVGSATLFCDAPNSIAIINEEFLGFNIHYNIEDLVEYLKLKYPECVKCNDIKIALKN